MKMHFIQHVNGMPTYFVEKIHQSLRSPFFGHSIAFSEKHVPESFDFVMYPLLKPKHHTIRKDVKKSWKPGSLIEFIVNFREQQSFLFAPVLPVISTQRFSIKYHDNTFLVYIDKKLFFFGNRDFTVNEFENYEGMLKLAQNEGFDSIKDFCGYFNENYKGKIIHWTDLKY